MGKINLEELGLDRIKPLSGEAMGRAQKRWDSIAKPLNGLGRLEELIVQIAGIQERAQASIKKRAILVMCADNGIVEEGVTQAGQEVTAIVAANMARGLASVNKMSKAAGIDVIPVDIGMAADVGEAGLLKYKVAYGTKNFSKAPAMTEAEVLQAIKYGIDIVKEKKAEGYEILGTGEMGIGNTTTASAVAGRLLGISAREVTGRGAGLDDKGLKKKKQVIEEAWERYDGQMKGVLETISCIGGLDLAGLAGVFLGGAIYRIPVVADGMISCTAALVAAELAPLSRQYMLPSHEGREPVCKKIMEVLSFHPIIYGDLALGEGTGAALLFPMLDMAMAVYQENETFEQIKIDAYQKY